MPARLEHATLVASDLARSLVFYDAALAALGLVRVAEHADEEDDDPAIEAVGWAVPGDAPVVWVVVGDLATRGANVTLRADCVDDVRGFYDAAIGAGGVGHDAPRRWTIYRAGEFSATVSDPDGNLIEAVAFEDSAHTSS